MIYMAVTADKYELPIIVAGNAQELADRLHISINTVYSSISKNMSGKRNGYRIMKVSDEDGL